MRGAVYAQGATDLRAEGDGNKMAQKILRARHRGKGKSKGVDADGNEQEQVVQVQRLYEEVMMEKLEGRLREKEMESELLRKEIADH